MTDETTLNQLRDLASRGLISGEIAARALEWLEGNYSDEIKEQLAAIVKAGDHKTLTESFYTAMEFGTGGLRGIIGVGTNRMNIYTVRRATAGLAEFLRTESRSKSLAVAIAYDCRNKSYEFTKNAAMTLAARGIKTYIFADIKPTPVLSFAVRYLGAMAGIVITASHNPPEYNGYKVSDKTGCQVVPPWDSKIIGMVNAVTDLATIPVLDFDQARADKLVEMLETEIDKDFLGMVKEYVADFPGPDLDKLKVVYTALHGTGYKIIPEAMRQIGLEELILVKEQCIPDGKFPTTRSPNPEEREGLALGINYMEEHDADLLIATDPDADRVGIACRNHNQEIELLSGNKTLSLLTDFVLSVYQGNNRLKGKNVVVKTVVTTDLVRAIADKYGVETIETLTGFKYIGEKINEYEKLGQKNGGKAEKINPAKSREWARCQESIRREWYQKYSKYYVLGGEESYGYSQGTYLRDKDSITSSLLIAKMTAYWKKQGKTLTDRLEELYAEFGYFEEGVLNYTFAGIEGKQKMNTLMQLLRTAAPKSIGGATIISAADLQKVQIKDSDGKKMPKADVVIFELENGQGKVVARPSGTEPKIKFYVLGRQTVSNGDILSARQQMAKLIAAIKDDISRMVKEV